MEWHIRNAWKELLFVDDELDQNRDTRDPVLLPESSAGILAKKSTHRTTGGLPVQSFASLLRTMDTLTRNTCVMRADGPCSESASVPARRDRCSAAGPELTQTAAPESAAANPPTRIYRGRPSKDHGPQGRGPDLYRTR